MFCIPLAQAQSYRVTPLAKIDFDPVPHIQGTAGINEKGQVVYGYRHPTTELIHAFVWLPAGDYDRSAGFHDLSEYTGTSFLASIARDINIWGDIVGQAAVNNTNFGPITGTAAIWVLDPEATESYYAIGTGGAHGINDRMPPQFVGDFLDAGDCGCPPPNPPLDLDLVRRAYVYTLDPDPRSPTALYPGIRSQSYGRDINTPAESYLPVWAVGFADCDYLTTNGFCIPIAGCHPTRKATRWSGSSPTTFDGLATGHGAEILGVNSNYGCIGWSYTGQNGCPPHAVYWPGGGDPVDVGEFMPKDQEGNSSIGAAISNHAFPIAVGWDFVRTEAMSWQMQSGDTWEPLNLNSDDAIGTWNAVWYLRRAHDINDALWIVVDGVEVSTADRYLLLLTPFSNPTCPADIAPPGGDGEVGVPDMLAVIANWGACSQGTICFADINNDGTVGVPDLLAVLAAWGPCQSFAPEEAPSWMQEIMEILYDPELSDAEKLDLIELLLEQNS